MLIGPLTSWFVSLSAGRRCGASLSPTAKAELLSISGKRLVQNSLTDNV